jgi:hypothetical protein
METAPSPKKSSRIYGILATLLWMLVSFIAGMYVGIHPKWVPNMPWVWQPSTDQPPARTVQFPASQPSADNSAVTPQTQPSAQGQ